MNGTGRGQRDVGQKVGSIVKNVMRTNKKKIKNMKISKSTKVKIKRTARKVGNILFKAWFIFLFSLLVFHFGRYYQDRQFIKGLEKFGQRTIKTYYFIDPQVVDPIVNATSDLYVTGELEIGICINQRDAESIGWINKVIQ